MKLADTGESRVRGYLFVLERSLRSFLPREVAADAVREVESHIRERVDQAEAAPDESAAVERILAELGPPLRVAQAYSHEMTLDEAVATGRFVPMLRALWHAATTSVVGFLWALFVFVGWTVGLSFFVVAFVKVILPNNVGVFLRDGAFSGAGVMLWLPPGIEAHPFGYWVIPVSLALGLGILVGTQRASRRILGWMRSRRPPARIAVKVEVRER
jgi:uncharacterized membrane protein